MIYKKDKRLKELYDKHHAMMAGQWTDGDYLEEFQRICDFYCLDSLTEWEILEDSIYTAVDKVYSCDIL